MAIATVPLWPLARLIHAPGWVVPSLSSLRQRKLWWASIMIIIIVHNIRSMGHIFGTKYLPWPQLYFKNRFAFPCHAQIFVKEARLPSLMHLLPWTWGPQVSVYGYVSTATAPVEIPGKVTMLAMCILSKLPKMEVICVASSCHLIIAFPCSYTTGSSLNSTLHCS